MSNLLNESIDLWRSGGWGMVALAANSLILFGVGADVWMRLWSKGYRAVSESVWRAWLTQPDARRGAIGRLINEVMRARSINEMQGRFEELRAAETAPFERDLRFMKICVAAAPLLGLLGTVTGMLATFNALAVGAGGQRTMDLVAGGISEALITTETGLVIALPGFFLHHYLCRERDRYNALLNHLQTLCTQHLYRQPPEART